MIQLSSSMTQAMVMLFFGEWSRQSCLSHLQPISSVPSFLNSVAMWNSCVIRRMMHKYQQYDSYIAKKKKKNTKEDGAHILLHKIHSPSFYQLFPFAFFYFLLYFIYFLFLFFFFQFQARYLIYVFLTKLTLTFGEIFYFNNIEK